MFLSSQISKEDQVIEKYYYYVFSNFFARKGRKNFFLIFLSFLLIASVFFYFKGISPLVSLVFLPMGLVGYFLAPWLTWKYSVDPLWKSTYSSFNKKISISENEIVLLLDQANEVERVIKINPSDIYKILYNRKHLILFFLDKVSLINVELEDDKRLRECRVVLKEICKEAEIKETKVKNNLL